MTYFILSSGRCALLLAAVLAILFVGQIDAAAVPTTETFAPCSCEPLPPPGDDETVVTVKNVSELQAAIDSASGPTTIYLEIGKGRRHGSRWYRTWILY